MYHYVRPLDWTRYPDINGLNVRAFDHQLAHLEANYEFVTRADVLAAIDGRRSLPEDAAILTFDDGLADHYDTVLPRLSARDIQGWFFPPSRPIREDVVLDVHKIHFLLAARDDLGALLDDVFDRVRTHAGEYDLEDPDRYFDRLAEPGRYDPPEVVFVKRLLQRELPPPAREQILNDLFDDAIEIDEATFNRELYLTEQQLQHMVESGMYVGSHGHTHRWLDRLPPAEQAAEVDASLELLDAVGAPTDRWVMAYPYGAYDEKTLDLLDDRGAGLGLTTVPEIATVTPTHALTIPRIDTNDLPQSPAGDAGEV
jgi:peptidoglycan/xylan/chitin deacetylase (PgdA/CDA1 family)